MNAVFGEIGKKLGEKWVLLLSLPGVLFVSLLTATAAVGGRDWARPEVREDLLHDAEQRVGQLSTHLTAAAILLVGLLLAGYGTALLAQACGAAVRGCWLSAAPFRWLMTWWLTPLRRALWQARDRRSAAATTDHARAAAATARNAISLAPPARPTWMADRMAALTTRVRNAYGLDVEFSWPALRTLLPEDLRRAVDDAQVAFERSAQLSGWGLLHLAAGAATTAVGWHGWPMVVLGAASGTTGWVYGRTSAGALASLVETAYDLVADDLVAALTGRPTVAEGEQATETLRKGA